MKGPTMRRLMKGSTRPTSKPPRCFRLAAITRSSIQPSVLKRQMRVVRVVDYNMPGMSGIELVARLEERHLHCPVILITSGAAHDVTERGAHPDIREVLEKPLE